MILRPLLPAFVLALTAILSWAVMVVIPYTLHYPVLRSSLGGVQFMAIRNGEAGIDACVERLKSVADALRHACPDCISSAQCVLGIEGELRMLLSGNQLPMASLRSPNHGVTMTIQAQNQGEVCRAIEAKSAEAHSSEPLRCYPAFASR